MKEKTCQACYERLPITAFYRDAKKSDGRRPSCKECEGTPKTKLARDVKEFSELLRDWNRVF